ncbi:MAG: MarR family transcriptional regulator [Candidatus Dormibacteraeota bacterium]|nr:MarR family transcriptional regulator [Candidatus Dormibacteraeota bacterium]
MSSRDRERLAEELAGEMADLQASIDAVDQVVADYLGINRTDFRALDQLARRGRQTAGKLAEAVGISPGSLTLLLDRLTRAGYVRRVPDESNRRRVWVELTPRTWQLVDRLFSQRARAGRERMKPYGPEQLALVLDFIRATNEYNASYAAWVASLPPTSGEEE